MEEEDGLIQNLRNLKRVRSTEDEGYELQTKRTMQVPPPPIISDEDLVSDDVSILTQSEDSESMNSNILHIKNCSSLHKIHETILMDQSFRSWLEQETDTNPIAIIFDVNENFNEEDLGKKISVLFVQSKKLIVAVKSANNKYQIFWKTNMQQRERNWENFIKLDLTSYCIYEETFKFIVTFILKEIKAGYTGLMDTIDIKNLNDVPLNFISDVKNKNLLMHAVQLKDTILKDKLIKNLLKCSFNINHKCKENESAASLAWNSQYKNEEVLLLLLRANSMFPKNFNENEVEYDPLIEFIEDCKSVHEAIKENVGTDVINSSLEKNKDLRHFYSTKNKSIISTALENKNISLYQFLIIKGIYRCQYETEDLTKKLDKKDKERIKKFHKRRAKGFPGEHLLALEANSQVIHDELDPESKFPYVRKAFEFLNSIEQIRTILEVVAKSRTFKIIFDFQRSSAHEIDPTCDASTRGVFYTDGYIFIAAKEFLDKNTFLSGYGTLAHELCHFAMHIMYGNHCRPYPKPISENSTKYDKDYLDNKLRSNFKKITRDFKDMVHEEVIIGTVFKAYEDKMHEAELIARAPQILTIYSNNSKKLNKLTEVEYMPLFSYFDDIVKDIKKKMPLIEMQGILEAERFCEKKLAKKRRKIGIVTVCVISLAVLLILISIFGTCLYMARKTCTNCTYDELLEDQKKEILSKIGIYNGSPSRLMDIMGEEDTVESLRMLNGTKIQELRNQEYFLMGNGAFVSSNTVPFKFSKNKKKNFTLEYLLDEINKKKIVLILGEAGCGKSTALQEAGYKIKQKNETNIYAGFIKLGEYREYIENELDQNTTWDGVIKVLLKLLNINDELEILIFKNKFRKDEIILFWDGINELYLPESINKILNIIKLLRENKFKQWITSRFTNCNIEKELSVKFYELNHMDKQDVSLFVDEFIKNNFNDSRFEKLSKIVHDKLKYIETIDSPKIINNRLFLKMIIEIIAANINKKVNLDNLYTIYDEYIKIIFDKLDKFPKDLLETKTEAYDALKFECHELIALKSIFKGIFLDNINSVYLKVQKKSESLQKVNMYNINGTISIDHLHILKLYQNDFNKCVNITLLNLTSYNAQHKLMFHHQTFPEHFIAKYLHNSFFGIIANRAIETTDINTKLRLLIFVLLNDETKFIRDRLMESITKSDLIHRDVCGEMIKEFPKIFEILNYDLEGIIFLSRIFKTNLTVIDTLWSINSSETGLIKFIKYNYHKNKFDVLFTKLLDLIEEIFGQNSSRVIQYEHQKLYILSTLWYVNNEKFTDKVAIVMKNLTDIIDKLRKVKLANFYDFYEYINTTTALTIGEKRQFFNENFKTIFSMYIESSSECELIWQEMSSLLSRSEIHKLILERTTDKQNFLDNFIYQNSPEYFEYMIEKIESYVEDKSELKRLIIEQEASNGFTPLMNVAFSGLYGDVAPKYYKFITKILNPEEIRNHLYLKTKFNYTALHLSTWNRNSNTFFDIFREIYESVFNENDLKSIILGDEINNKYETANHFIKKLKHHSNSDVCKKAIEFLLNLLRNEQENMTSKIGISNLNSWCD